MLKDKPVERVVFNAITKDAILEAMKHPRQIDASLVEAYLARRALDYLVGFKLSPVLWRKLPGARNRPAACNRSRLRLVCDRELEIEKFVAREYWSLVAHLRNHGRRALHRPPRRRRRQEDHAPRYRRWRRGRGFQAAIWKRPTSPSASVEAKPAKRHPYAAVHDLDAAAGSVAQARHGAGKSPMQVAQQLYEGVDIGGETVGLITYMRTDGVDVAPEAVAGARAA